jgi:hypothetical protein
MGAPAAPADPMTPPAGDTGVGGGTPPAGGAPAM